MVDPHTNTVIHGAGMAENDFQKLAGICALRSVQSEVIKSAFPRNKNNPYIA